MFASNVPASDRDVAAVPMGGPPASGRWSQIRGGRVFGADTEHRPVFLCGDRIAPPPPPDTVFTHDIDASGCDVIAGGIDLHTHIGGGKLSIARMLMASEMSSPRRDCDYLPSPSVAADRYLDIGYTTCFEPAMIAANARSAHFEMASCRGLATGGYCLLGNEPALLAMIADKVDRRIIAAYVAAMVAATGAIAIKVVNAGGIDAFKFNRRAMDVDGRHPRFEITPGDVIRTLCRAAADIGMQHPLHVHCSNLGVPGNIQSTLATIAAADGLPIHLTHAQFHSYGKSDAGMTTAAAQLAAAMQTYRNVTIDVGQIVFGQTVTISADTMHQYNSHGHGDPRKSVIVDAESGGGCGVVPFKYRRKRFVGALQWAIGLELFLMVDDPARVFLTTDHPNGGPFTAYPHLIRLLADRSFRASAIESIHADAAAASQLPGMDREYSMQDIHTMTRTGPADILGLHDRGRLRPGDVADIVVIDRSQNWQARFEQPHAVFAAGQLVRQRGQRIEPIVAPEKHTILCGDRERLSSLAADADHAGLILDYQNRFGDRTFAHHWIAEDEFENNMNCQLVATGAAS